jgi:hypothetical protein
MSSNYYATLYSHDGILLVKMNNYNEKTLELMNKIHPHYSIGGILKGDFIGNVNLGSHLISFDDFIKDVLEEANYSTNKAEIEHRVKQLMDEF